MILSVDLRWIVLFAAAAVALALGLSLAAMRGGCAKASGRWLAISNAALLTAVAGLMARPWIGFEVSAFLVLGGTLAGIACGFLALRTTLGLPAPGRLALVLAGLLVVMETGLACLVDSVVPLMLLSSVVNGGLGLVLAVAAWRLTLTHGPRAAMLLSLPFAVLGTAYLARLPTVLLLPFETGAMAATAVIVLCFAGAALLLTFGVMMLREAEARRNMAHARVEAETASRAKSDFLRSMSHELRTPLNGVIGMAELMRSEALGPLPPAYREQAGVISTSGRHLLSLIEDLLDLSAIEAGRLGLEETALDPGRAAEDAFAMVAERARSAGLALCLEREADFDLHADRRRLVQILLNLVVNAVKYADASTVAVRIGLDARGDPTLAVSDDGIGMDETQAAEAMRLFGRIGQAAEGNGLGLPLARELAEAHGGRLDLESTPGHGTTVTLTLPAARLLPRASAAGADRERPADRPADRRTAAFDDAH